MKKTALITGANRGLGLALAEVFQPHYKLILHSRQRDEDLKQRFPKADFLVGDIAKSFNFATWISKLDNIKLSILINNAGTYLNKDFDKLPPQDVFTVITTNLLAPILMTKLAWSLLENGAIVVNISSLAAFSPGPGEAIYAASKAGLSAFSEGLQYDGTKNGIRIMDVRLGAMKTEMSTGRKDWHKFIEPLEAADAILAMCQDYMSLRPTCIEIKRRRY